LWITIKPSLVWSQNEDVTLRFSPARPQLAVGETIETAVEVSSVSDLYGFDITISYDPNIVEVVDFDPDLDGIQVALGLFLDPGFVIFNQADNDLGQLRLVMTQLNPSESKSGTGNLMVVRFRARQTGETPLLLVAGQLAQRDGTSFFPELQSDQLTVVTTSASLPTAVSIPTRLAGTPLPTATPELLAAPLLPAVTPSATMQPPTSTSQPTVEAVVALDHTSTPAPAVPTPAAKKGSTAGGENNLGPGGETPITAVGNATGGNQTDSAIDVPETPTMAVAALERPTETAVHNETAVSVVGSSVSEVDMSDKENVYNGPEPIGQSSWIKVSLITLGLVLASVFFLVFWSRKNRSQSLD